MLIKAQTRWAGHMVRMKDHRLPKKLLYEELQTGSRKAGGQKKCFKDTLKTSLTHFKIDTNSWENLAQDRSVCRHRTESGAAAAENLRQHVA